MLRRLRSLRRPRWAGVLAVVVAAGTLLAGDSAGAGPAQEGELVAAKCTWRPPLDEAVRNVRKGREARDGVDLLEPRQPSAIPGVPTGQDIDAFKQLLRWMGFFDDVEEVWVPNGAPEWWTTEVFEKGECYLGTHPPHRCDLDTYTPGDGLLPDRCIGTYKSSQYDINYSTGGFANFEDYFNGMLSDLLFGVGKGAMQISMRIIDYAYEFDLVNSLGAMSTAAASAYDANVVGPLELGQIAWLAFVGYVALLLVRGRIALAGSELVVSVLLLLVFTAVQANPTGYMQGAADSVTDLSSAVLRVGGCGEPGELIDRGAERNMTRACAREELKAIQKDLHEIFVEEPYKYINWNWNERFEEQCATQMDHILQTGPHDSDDWPRIYMAEGGPVCADAAVWNADPTVERTFMSLLSALMGLLVAAVLVGMAVTILMSKFVIAILFAVFPLVFPLAVLPGRSRRLAVSWMTTLLQAIVVAVGMSLILSLFMIGVDAAAAAPRAAGQSLIERWITLIGLLVLLWYARKRFLTGVQGALNNLGDRLSTPGALGGGGGFGGGGYRPPATSSPLFGSTGLRPTESLALATSAAGVAGIGVNAGLTGAGLVFGGAARLGGIPVNLLKNRASAHRIYRQNIAQYAISRAIEGVPTGGVGGGGGGAGGGLRRILPREALQQFLHPRHQRLYEDNVAVHTARRNRTMARRDAGAFTAEWWRLMWEGAKDNTWGAVARVWQRNAPVRLGGNPARADPERYPSPTLRILRRRESRHAAKMYARVVELDTNNPSLSAIPRALPPGPSGPRPGPNVPTNIPPRQPAPSPETTGGWALPNRPTPERPVEHARPSVQEWEPPSHVPTGGQVPTGEAPPTPGGYVSPGGSGSARPAAPARPMPAGPSGPWVSPSARPAGEARPGVPAVARPAGEARPVPPPARPDVRIWPPKDGPGRPSGEARPEPDGWVSPSGSAAARPAGEARPVPPPARPDVRVWPPPRPTPRRRGRRREDRPSGGDHPPED